MLKSEIIRWLREEDGGRLEELWRLADETRRANVGDEVHLRGLVEFSNHCARRCAYCGLNVGNESLVRYRMTLDAIVGCARKAVEFGYGTVVLQSGEDYGATAEWMAAVVRRIKNETPLAVTLSLGERSDDDLRLWREAGADRYLLRFETSNPRLFERTHPSLPGRRSDRIAILRALRRLGYETGSGVMIGIPGQTYEDLADDILLFRGLDLDMIGVGPFIPHPSTPLGQRRNPQSAIRNSQSPQSFPPTPAGQQAPNDELMTYKVVALSRLVCPRANIPSTTALATLNLAGGRELALRRGANVVMPNLTPPEYRTLYEIYPAKACLRETAEQCHVCLKQRIEAIGRRTGEGRGDARTIR